MTHDEYEAAGYTPFRNPIDADVVAEIRCSNCGGPTYYRGLRDPQLGTRHAFAICKRCDWEIEF